MSKMVLKNIILLLVYLVMEVQSAKILAVFPVPSISHQVVFRKITQELVKRGHEVTVITPDPAYTNGKSPSNLKEIDVHDVSYEVWKKIMQYTFESNKLQISKFEEIRAGSLVLSQIFITQFHTPEVQKLISEKNDFDVILIEAVILPALVFSHIFKAPVILVSSFGAILNNHDIMGSPTHPLFYPSLLNKKVYNLTLSEKINKLYSYFMTQYALYLNEADESAMLKQLLGPDVPTIRELYNNVDMFFMNIHPMWVDSQPVPPSVVYMGGIHQLPEKELPKDLKEYLDSSKQGVIYVSFGTNVLAKMIPARKVEIMSKVLSSLPYNVLWKWDTEEIPGKTDKIKISKWFPQSDLLKHPNIKLFITQAGLQSTDEAITAGVPLVAIPMLGDQWYNAEKYVKYGIGIKLDIETLNTEDFKHAVETVINNKSYRENIVKLREMMNDQPEPPLQRTLWWIEYVVRNKGAKHLKAPTANISYYEYLAVDAIIVVLLIVFISLILLVTVCVFLLKLITKLLFGYQKIKTS